MEGNSRPNFVEHEIDWDDEKVSCLWNYYSRTLLSSDAYFSKMFGHHILRHSGLNLGESLNVLDFGCGPGFIWEHLKRLNSRWQYTGVDFSPDSVNEVTHKAADDKNFRQACYVSSLPTDLPEAHFDVVLMFEVVEHLNDMKLRASLVEIARLLKKGGVLVITTPNEEDLARSKKFCPECGAIFHEWQHVRNWNPRSLADYLCENGFVVRYSETLDFWAQGWGIANIFRKAKRTALRLMTKKQSDPHMIAVFQAM